MRRSKPQVFEMDLEIERGSASVEYVVTYTVAPGEPATGPTYDCGGTPGCGPGVEDVEVWLETKVKNGEPVRARRPELDDLVTEEELLEHAGVTGNCEPDDDDDDDDDANDREIDLFWEGRSP